MNDKKKKLTAGLSAQEDLLRRCGWSLLKNFNVEDAGHR